MSVEYRPAEACSGKLVARVCEQLGISGAGQDLCRVVLRTVQLLTSTPTAPLPVFYLNHSTGQQTRLWQTQTQVRAPR